VSTALQCDSVLYINAQEFQLGDDERLRMLGESHMCAWVVIWPVELHSRHALCRSVVVYFSTCSALQKASLMQSWPAQEVHRLGREHDQGGGHRVQVQARRWVPGPLHRAGRGLQQARAGDWLSAQGWLPFEADVAFLLLDM